MGVGMGHGHGHGYRLLSACGTGYCSYTAVCRAPRPTVSGAARCYTYYGSTYYGSTYLAAAGRSQSHTILTMALLTMATLTTATLTMATLTMASLTRRQLEEVGHVLYLLYLHLLLASYLAAAGRSQSRAILTIPTLTTY